MFAVSLDVSLSLVLIYTNAKTLVYGALSIGLLYLLVFSRRLLIGSHWRTGADKVPVAVSVVNPSHRRPVLVRARRAGGEATLHSGVSPIPFLASDIKSRMRRVAQRRIGDGEAAVFDLLNLTANGDHGVAEPIQLRLRFRFSRLDHERFRHRKTHGGGMKAVINEALGDVIDRNPSGVLQRARVDNAFVRDAAMGVSVKHGEACVEARGYVIRRQDRHF